MPGLQLTWARWRRFLVEGARALGVQVIDRCNLTVLLEPGQEGLADFLAANQVGLASSGWSPAFCFGGCTRLPCCRACTRAGRRLARCCRQVRVVASLPCYSAGNVEEQRGRGVFARSIQALRDLNAAGYGRPGSGLALDLVYNPNGAFLAPPQAALEVRCASGFPAAFLTRVCPSDTSAVRCLCAQLQAMPPCFRGVSARL
jgi:hypothetical protein